jgi:hypothetical protein
MKKGKQASRVPALALAATVATALAGCALGPKKAEDSAIALGKGLVLQSVPLGGMAVQALVSAGDGEDRGSYKYKSDLFCQSNLRALDNIRTEFAKLCEVKGARYDGQFCVQPQGTDQVLFSARVERNGSGCYRLNVSEAVVVGSPEYLEFLVGQAGYETAETRSGKLAAQQAAQAEARAKAQIERQAKLKLEMARLERELPQMRKRGARVCIAEPVNSVVYLGYVEDFTDEKLKITVAEAFLSTSRSVRPTGFQPHVMWDEPVRWRLC